MKDGRLDGPSVAIVKALQARVGDATPIEVVPWARALRALENDRNVALFSTTRTREQWLKGLGFTNLQSVSSDSVNCRKLLAGRIDVWLTGDIDMNAICHEQGIDPAELEIACVAKRQELYQAFSKATPDGTVRRWQDAFESLVREGSFKAIHRQYGVLAY